MRRHGQEFVLADIPGLIEGASEGIGIGDRFLGHIERCRILLHLIDASGEDPIAAWHEVQNELALYGAGLAEKPQLLALNKIDSIDEETCAELSQALEEASGQKVLLLSGATGQGLDPILDQLITMTGRAMEKAQESSAQTEKIWSPI